MGYNKFALKIKLPITKIFSNRKPNVGNYKKGSSYQKMRVVAIKR